MAEEEQRDDDDDDDENRGNRDVVGWADRDMTGTALTRASDKCGTN